MTKGEFFKEMKAKFGDWNAVNEKELKKLEYKRPGKIYSSLYEYLEVNPHLLTEIRDLHKTDWSIKFYTEERESIAKKFFDKNKFDAPEDYFKSEEQKYIFSKSVEAWIENFHEKSIREFNNLKASTDRRLSGMRYITLVGKEHTIYGIRPVTEEKLIDLGNYKKLKTTKFLLKESGL